MKEGELGKTYADGEVIFAEGDKGEVMYVIQAGEVKVSKHTPEGEIVLAVLGSGEILGEMALFDRLTRSATATAIGEARILSVDKEKLFSTISSDPTLVFKIIETMSHRIRKLDKDFAELRGKARSPRIVNSLRPYSRRADVRIDGEEAQHANTGGSSGSI